MTDEPPGVDEWKAQTSAFDRVRSVADTLSQPQSAPSIATEAHVAENTARDHLDRLVEMNILLRRDREGTTVYAPDPLHTRVQTLRDLLDDHDHDGLIRLKADIQDRIDGLREKYDVESAKELRELAASTESAAETRDILDTANDWELLSYRLGIVEDAIENYATYSRDPPVSA